MRQTAYSTFTDQYGDTQRYQVTYPEALIFAHSRHTYFDIDELRDVHGTPNAGANVIVTIIDNTTGANYSEYRNCDSQGKATFDVGRFLQIFMQPTLKEDTEFDYNTQGQTPTISKMVAAHSVTVKLKYNGVFFFDEDFEVVNGANEPGDDWWCGQRRLKWWYNYPFTFDFRNIDEANVNLNGGTTSVENLPMVTPDTMTYSRIRINPKGMHSSANTMLISTNNLGMSIEEGQLQDKAKNSVLLIGNACAPSEKNIYLRWLNRHGEMCYWLFNRHSMTRKVTATDSQRAYIKDERYDEMNTCDNATLRQLTAESEIKIFTDSLDGIDYEFIRQIFTAPIVHMYLPKHSTIDVPRWQRVNIKAETQSEPLQHSDTYTRNRQVSITITLPEEGGLFL